MLKSIPGRIAFAVVLLVAVGLVVAGCGGGTSTIAQAETEQAEKHGREEAQEKAKEQRLEQKLKKLERENRQAKKRHREKEQRLLKEERAHVSPPPSSSGSAPEPVTPSGTDCGGGTIAGPETSCGFALNTRAEYEAFVGSGSGTVEAWSEANEELYPMYCTEGSEHECSGAISATVYWP